MDEAIKVQIANNEGAAVEGAATIDRNGEWVVEFEGGFVKFPACTEAELADHITKHNNANLKPTE